MGQDLPSYIADPRYKLIKPHGSVNWFHPVLSGISLNNHPYSLQIINRIDEMEISDQLITQSEHSAIDDLPALPAISIPVARKTQFEAPSEHIDFVRDLMSSVTHLLVIGWRGNEEHFRGLLEGIDRSRIVSLVATSGNASASLVARSLGLSAELPAVSPGGFTALVQGAELGAFLAR